MVGADVCLNLDELGQLAAHLEALKRIAGSQNRLLADRTLLQFQSAHDPLLSNLLNYSAIHICKQNKFFTHFVFLNHQINF